VRIGVDRGLQDLLGTGHGQRGHLGAQGIAGTSRFLFDFGLGLGLETVAFGLGNCLGFFDHLTGALIGLLDQFRSVVVLLLIAATAVSLLLGDAIEAAAIAAVLAINAVIGFTTEFRARRAMEAILGLDVPLATVARNGTWHLLNARDLVPGDVIELEAGHQVPADARVITSTDLRINEAPLTGESLPSSKRAEQILSDDTPLADRSNMAYTGTTVAAGLGRAVVTATGRATEVGRIGELMGTVKIVPTPLERRLDAQRLLLEVRIRLRGGDLREPDQDLALRQVVVLLDDLLAGHRIERPPHLLLSGALDDERGAAREIDAER